MLKEHHLRSELKKIFPNIKMIFNKEIDNGCSKRRPDVRIECLTHTVIVECDENQHKKNLCEDKRTMEIFRDLGNRPLIMIIFNPDKYEKNEGCFKSTKTGYLSLNKKEWNKRISTLVEKIKYYTENLPTKDLTEDHMYYDV
jgi:hypothetical protein